jgi:hypothetical protein
LELASFAQNVATQLGLRNMAGLLNTGVDLHSPSSAREWLASRMTSSSGA